MAFTGSVDEIVERNPNGLLGAHPDWARVRLGDAAQIKNGAPFASSKFNSDGEGMPLVRIRDVVRGSTDTHYSGEFDEQFVVEPGDLLIGMDGDFNHALWAGPRSLLNQRVCRLDFAEDSPLLKEFVRYALGGYLKAVNDETPSVTVKHLSSKTVAAIPLPCPTKKEQKAIVAQIDRLFSGITTGREALAEALRQSDALRRSALTRAIDAGTQQTVGDLLDGVEAGKSFRCHSYPADNGGWGVIKVSAMTWGAFLEKENKAVFDKTKVESGWEIQPGDLLLSRANTSSYVGASVLVGDCRPRLLLSDKSLRLKVREGVDARWLQLALSAPGTRARMSEVATGTSDSMRNLSQAKLSGLQIRVPTLREQVRLADEISRRLESIANARAVIDSQLERAVSLRNSVLRRYCSGRHLVVENGPMPAAA